MINKKKTQFRRKQLLSYYLESFFKSNLILFIVLLIIIVSKLTIVINNFFNRKIKLFIRVSNACDVIAFEPYILKIMQCQGNSLLLESKIIIVLKTLHKIQYFLHFKDLYDIIFNNFIFILVHYESLRTVFYNIQKLRSIEYLRPRMTAVYTKNTASEKNQSM